MPQSTLNVIQMWLDTIMRATPIQAIGPQAVLTPMQSLIVAMWGNMNSTYRIRMYDLNLLAPGTPVIDTIMSKQFVDSAEMPNLFKVKNEVAQLKFPYRLVCITFVVICCNKQYLILSVS